MNSDNFLHDIAALPHRSVYTERDLLLEPFQLLEQGDLSVYYAPFDHINRDAHLILVGITPGFYQMEIAYREFRQALLEGETPSGAMRRVKQQASFAGSMRVNLLSMLDRLGVPSKLGITSTRALYEDRADLVHSTSALRYPVFVDGKNYTGHRPELMRTPVLVEFVETLLTEELAQIPDALIVPLGDAAQSAVEHLVTKGVIDTRRCLLGFPHPSGGNGHRVKHFNERRKDLERRVNQWRAA